MNGKYSQPAPVTVQRRRWPSRSIESAPSWCAVDLRDGNQALPNPMTPQQKREYFQLLVDVGFKQIEVGFPSASHDDFQFCRDLIEQNAIPDDVTISVLTQAREHLVARTMEALRGARHAVCHVYTATSDLHMRFVFGKSPEETKAMALEAVRMVKQAVPSLAGSQIGLEFSPEEFTDSDLDFTVDICDAVVEAWDPAPGEKVILNLPATVERRLPHQYADMIELFMRRQKHGKRSIISLHAHNDMGTAVAATELALMAGGQRVEGTLFGHGERCGNVDLVTLALNLQYLGLDTGLNFADLESIRDRVERLTGMPVHARTPYAGELVFTAFSGSHQDAIHKGLNHREELAAHFGGWKIPYLHLDPADIGRSYEKFIRINSQSGKGGIAHVLQRDHGICLPRSMLLDLSKHVQAFADRVAREVNGEEVWEMFRQRYIRPEGTFRLVRYWPRPESEDPTRIEGEVQVVFRGQEQTLRAASTGPISAFVHALQQLPIPAFTLDEYEEDAIGAGEDAEAVTYIRLQTAEGRAAYGVGTGANIDQAAVRAIISALNGLIPA